MYCGVALRGYRGGAHRKVSTHRFCAAKLLALKSIGFLMTGKKKARRNAYAFQAFFRSMAQKDLLLSDACLPFCGRSLLFFCRRFLFQIKRKCRNAGSIYHLIIVHSEGKKRFLRGFRAAVAAAVRRGRRTLQVAPNRLQISIHQPVLSYYAALYMQKSRQTLLPGLLLFYKVY